MKLTSSEYRAMMDKGKKEKPEPSGKSGKLDTVAALKAMGNYFELDPKSVNFVISQWKISGKI
jgi:hypothetical protein